MGEGGRRHRSRGRLGGHPGGGGRGGHPRRCCLPPVPACRSRAGARAVRPRAPGCGCRSIPCGHRRYTSLYPLRAGCGHGTRRRPGRSRRGCGLRPGARHRRCRTYRCACRWGSATDRRGGHGARHRVPGGKPSPVEPGCRGGRALHRGSARHGPPRLAISVQEPDHRRVRRCGCRGRIARLRWFAVHRRGGAGP